MTTNTPKTASSAPARAESHQTYVVLTGNPNCGKTTLFNSLTGLRAKVGNYAGVTTPLRTCGLCHPRA